MRACDEDGYLDAGERGTVTFQVTNGGVFPLVGSHATLSMTNGNITFPSGATVALSDLPPFGTTSCVFQKVDQVDFSMHDAITRSAESSDDIDAAKGAGSVVASCGDLGRLDRARGARGRAGDPGVCAKARSGYAAPRP